MTGVVLIFGATDDGLTAQFRRVNRQLEDFDRQAKRVSAGVADTFRKAIIKLTNPSPTDALRTLSMDNPRTECEFDGPD